MVVEHNVLKRRNIATQEPNELMHGSPQKNAKNDSSAQALAQSIINLFNFRDF